MLALLALVSSNLTDDTISTSSSQNPTVREISKNQNDPFTFSNPSDVDEYIEYHYMNFKYSDISQVSQNLICLSCKNISNHPIKHSCGAVFCTHCYSNALHTRNVICPSCLEVQGLNIMVFPSSLYSYLDEQNVKCPLEQFTKCCTNNNIPLKDFKNHLYMECKKQCQNGQKISLWEYIHDYKCKLPGQSGSGKSTKRKSIVSDDNNMFVKKSKGESLGSIARRLLVWNDSACNLPESNLYHVLDSYDVGFQLNYLGTEKNFDGRSGNDFYMIFEPREVDWRDIAVDQKSTALYCHQNYRNELYHALNNTTNGPCDETCCKSTVSYREMYFPTSGQDINQQLCFKDLYETEYSISKLDERALSSHSLLPMNPLWLKKSIKRKKNMKAQTYTNIKIKGGSLIIKIKSDNQITVYAQLYFDFTEKTVKMFNLTDMVEHERIYLINTGKGLQSQLDQMKIGDWNVMLYDKKNISEGNVITPMFCTYKINNTDAPMPQKLNKMKELNHLAHSYFFLANRSIDKKLCTILQETRFDKIDLMNIYPIINNTIYELSPPPSFKRN